MQVKQQLGQRTGRRSVPLLALLALFFLLGIFLGQVAAKRVPDEAGAELKRYLEDYLLLDASCDWRTVLSTLILYVRFPLAAALLGFASVGVVLLPVVSAVMGFFLSFSVCCFTATFGYNGVFLSLAVFGLRCAVTLPCFFLLAVPAWETSGTLAALSFGRGRRTAPVAYGTVCRRLGVCVLVLLAGVCVDIFLSPWLLRRMLEQILAPF